MDERDNLLLLEKLQQNAFTASLKLAKEIAQKDKDLMTEAEKEFIQKFAEFAVFGQMFTEAI